MDDKDRVYHPDPVWFVTVKVNSRMAAIRTYFGGYDKWSEARKDFGDTIQGYGYRDAGGTATVVVAMFAVDIPRWVDVNRVLEYVAEYGETPERAARKGTYEKVTFETTDPRLRP